MTFKNFEKDMQVILNFIYESELWSKSFKELLPESIIIVSVGQELLGSYIEKLEKKFPRTASSNWISYYLYECDRGRKPLTVVIDDEEILLDNIEKLYYIMSE